jgi:hypothetical protein
VLDDASNCLAVALGAGCRGFHHNLPISWIVRAIAIPKQFVVKGISEAVRGKRCATDSAKLRASAVRLHTCGHVRDCPYGVIERGSARQLNFPFSCRREQWNRPSECQGREASNRKMRKCESVHFDHVNIRRGDTLTKVLDPLITTHRFGEATAEPDAVLSSPIRVRTDYLNAKFALG